MAFEKHILQAMLQCKYKAWMLDKNSASKNPEQTNSVADPIDRLIKVAYELQIKESLPEKPTVLQWKAKKLLDATKLVMGNKEPPAFYKNKHCPDCLYRDECHQQLKAKDCISLLGGMTETILSKYHNKGIFTILQLSHLFRLRRRKRVPLVNGRFLWELKALAIREQKTYVLQTPAFENNAISIYLDFEGLPDESYIYLIGILVVGDDQTQQSISFWANNMSEESIIFLKLFHLLQQYPEANIYHYGSYETKAVRRFVKKTGSKDWERIEERMVNLLSYFRTHVYPPTYTNGLKEIATFLHYEWKDGDSNGLQSIRWRKSWEKNLNEKDQAKLIAYNQDDCAALAKIYDWLSELSSNDTQGNVQQISQMKKHSPYHLQNNPELGADFEYISKAAYFNYQREKIYWRGEKKITTPIPLSKSRLVLQSGRGISVWQPQKPNEIRQLPALQRCPHCGHEKVYHDSKQRSFIITDLKFTSKGIKQWVIEFRGGSGKCASCRKRYNDAVLKRSRYGDNLHAWALNLYVCYNISFALVSRLLIEQFGIWINPVYFNERLYLWWERFKPESEYCRQIIFNSPVIHIDETSVRLAKGKDKGYVWILATTHTVYYHLTLNRETSFLQEWLKDYKGIIVTDFYPGYETLKVKQQKCLIHLIRDLNDDLFKNPFDETYKEMVIAFNSLLKQVVATIDRYGLKKRNLHKYLAHTQAFYQRFIDKEYKDGLCIKYAKRFKKYWDSLWAFLQFDNVPWNNNNAEAAIKAFAQHRHGVNGQVSEGGLTEYLRILSIAQTCRYRNFSFLDFIRGKTFLWQHISPELLPAFLPFRQAKAFTHSLKIATQSEWKRRYETMHCPFIPPDPERVYSNTGWVDWKDWLG